MNWNAQKEINFIKSSNNEQLQQKVNLEIKVEYGAIQ